MRTGGGWCFREAPHLIVSPDVQVLGLGLHRDLLLALPRSPRGVSLDVSLPSCAAVAGQQAPLHCQASAADIEAMPPCDAIRTLDLSFVPINFEQVGAAT